MRLRVGGDRGFSKLRAAAALLVGSALVAALIFLGGAARSLHHSEGAESGAESGGGGESAEPANLWTVDTSRGAVRFACLPGLFGEETDPELDVESRIVGGSGLLQRELKDGVWAELAAGAPQQSEDGADFSPPYAAGGRVYPAALFVDQCAAPLNQFAFSGASTATGEDPILIFANPADAPVQVQVTGYASGGPLGTAPAITIPAQSVSSWRPAVWFPGEDQLGFRVEAGATGVSGWLQSTGYAGEVPAGSAILPASPLAAALDFPGAGLVQGDAFLHVLNPAAEPVRISVTALTTDGEQQLSAMGELLVEPGAVTITIAGLPKDATSLRVASVDSDPIAASLSVQLTGEHDPVATDRVTESRHLIAPALPVGTAPTFPGEEIRGILEGQGLTDIQIRAAAVVGDRSEVMKSDTVADQSFPASIAWLIEANSEYGPVAATVPYSGVPAGSAEQLVILEP